MAGVAGAGAGAAQADEPGAIAAARVDLVEELVEELVCAVEDEAFADAEHERAPPRASCFAGAKSNA